VLAKHPLPRGVEFLRRQRAQDAPLLFGEAVVAQGEINLLFGADEVRKVDDVRLDLALDEVALTSRPISSGSISRP
jgi:hypothetical protein